jgi:hypothetical protein
MLSITKAIGIYPLSSSMKKKRTELLSWGKRKTLPTQAHTPVDKKRVKAGAAPLAERPLSMRDTVLSCPPTSQKALTMESKVK